MKTRFLRSLFVLTVFAVVLVVVYEYTRPTGAGITEGNADRIKPGMTVAEVRAIFGCPPGKYAGAAIPGPCSYMEPSDPHTTLEWEGDSLHCLVFFDPSGKVIWSAGYTMMPDPRPFWRRVWDWLASVVA